MTKFFSAPLIAPTSASMAVPVAGKKGTALSGRHAIALACAVVHGKPMDEAKAFMATAKLHSLCTTVATLGGYLTKGAFSATGWATLGNAVLEAAPAHKAWVSPENAAWLLMQAAGSKHAAVWTKALTALGVEPLAIGETRAVPEAVEPAPQDAPEAPVEPASAPAPVAATPAKGQARKAA